MGLARMRWRVLFGFLLAAPFRLGPLSTQALITPDWSYYRNKKDLLAEVHAVVGKYPQVLRYEVKHEVSADGQYTAELPVLTFNIDRVTTDKVRALFSFGEHARELITSEVGLDVIKDLADRYQRVAMSDSLSALEAQADAALMGGGEVPLDSLIPRLTIKIVPMENLKGRDKVEGGAWCERKNGRGVDINRNFPVDWGRKERDYDPKEEYPGTSVLSEPESRALKGVADSFRPHAWVSTHSGMDALFSPYDHKNEVPTGEGPEAQMAILRRLNAEMCGSKCAVGPGGKTVGYLAHGTVTDWMYEEAGVAFASTWEIFGDFKAPYEECFQMFNPITKEGYDDVVSRWHKAFVRLLEMLPTIPAIRTLAREAHRTQQQQHGQGGQGGTETPVVEAATPGPGSAAKPVPSLVPSPSALIPGPAKVPLSGVDSQALREVQHRNGGGIPVSVQIIAVVAFFATVGGAMAWSRKGKAALPGSGSTSPGGPGSFDYDVERGGRGSGTGVGAVLGGRKGPNGAAYRNSTRSPGAAVDRD